jgi:uncharacterized membrane protein YedE/YeeE
MSLNILRFFVALIAGAVFAFGLVLSGMTDPVKVKGFLNVAGLIDEAYFGSWNPSLAFVMAGALFVMLPAFLVVPRLKKPLLDSVFHLPTRTDVDKPLIVGAVLFGLGWGLVGYCPGPALAALLLGGQEVLFFVVMMLVGMWAAKKLSK